MDRSRQIVHHRVGARVAAALTLAGSVLAGAIGAAGAVEVAGAAGAFGQARPVGVPSGAVAAFLSSSTASSSGGFGSTLPAGSSLRAGQELTAAHYVLAMQGDGNLVLSWSDFGLRPLWASNTAGHPNAHVTMQGDGNLVIYEGRRALWSSNTSGKSMRQYRLVLQDDGNLVIYPPKGVGIWSTHTDNTGIRIAPPGSPSFNGDAPDPDVVLSGGVFYAFTTGTALGNHIQVIVDTSGDPRHGWRSYTGKAYGSTALGEVPRWETANTQTSPGVARIGDHWVMFYDASSYGQPAGSGHTCLSVATATSLSPSHPVFADSSRSPLYCGQAASGGVLDPSPFVDPVTHEPFLLWKSNDGSSTAPSGVWVVPLDSAGTGFAGTPKEILTNDTARFGWETTLDDPSMFAISGKEVLTFSVGSWSSGSYAEAFAFCSPPTGPCTQPPGDPFLRSYGAVAGPGGGMTFTDAAGNPWIAYAAWSSKCTSYRCRGRRRLFIAPAAIA